MRLLSGTFSYFLFLSTVYFFSFTAASTTKIYTLSLHDALPISRRTTSCPWSRPSPASSSTAEAGPRGATRSEEHTSELQSLTNLVCRLLLEKKKKRNIQTCRPRSL